MPSVARGDTDKSRFFAITEFNGCVIIRSPNLSFNEYLPFCHFHTRAIARRRKSWLFHFRMTRILFAAKHSTTTLSMSRPLFLAIICRSRGRLSADEKEEKFASNDNVYYSTGAFHYI